MTTNILDLSLVAAVAENGVIGRGNALPWWLPHDLRRFREITTKKKVVIVGSSTFDSIVTRNGDILAGRHHIVLTKNRSLLPIGSVEAAASIDEAFAAVIRHGGIACVIGGKRVYELFLPFVQTIHLTTVHAPIEGDTYFPELRKASWRRNKVISKHWHPGDDFPTSFEELERITEPWQD